MEQRFACFVDGTQAGEVTVTRQGLYWKVEAVTEIRDARMMRAYVRTRSGEEALGVMVPQRGQTAGQPPDSGRPICTGTGGTLRGARRQ